MARSTGLLIAVGLILSGCQSIPTQPAAQAPEDVNLSAGLVLPIEKERVTIRQSNSPACLAFWERLTATANFAKAIEGHFQMPVECEKPTAELVGTPLEQAVKSCLARTGDNNSFSDECMGKLVFFRMGLIDQMSAESEDYSKASSEFLYNRFLLRYFVPLVAQDQHADLRQADQQKILDILKLRLPHSPRVARGQVVVDVLKWGTSAGESKQDALTHLQSSLAIAQKLNPEGEDLKELQWIMMMTQGKWDQYHQDHSQYLAKNPKSKVGRYYLASRVWDGKDRNQTREILKNLNQEFPADQRIRKTLVSVDSARLGDRIFTMNQNVELNSGSN